MGSCLSSASARVCAGLLISVTLGSWLGAAPAGAFTLRTVVVTGDVAPGTGGATYLDFGPVVLNQSGRVAFTASLEQGGDVNDGNDLGTWSEGQGALALVQRQGSLAPDTAVTWNIVTAPPVLNDAGQVGFRAFTNGGGAGVWHQGSGTLAAAAATGLAAADLPGLSYGSLFPANPAFNDAGQVAFHATLSGPGVTSSNNMGLWTGGPTGALSLVAREGNAAPGTSESWASLSNTLIDSNGNVSFRGTLTNGGDIGIWTGPAAGVLLAALEGQAAPDTTGDFQVLFPPDANGLGEVAFEALLETGVGGVTSSNDDGVWAGAPGSLGLVAREGEVAPDTGGRVFEDFGSPLTNAIGDVMFTGFLDTGSGLFLEDSGGLSKLVASGDTAPGTDLGLGDAVFGSFTPGAALNDESEIAFRAALSGLAQGVTSENNDTLWALDRNGDLVLIAREGDLFEYRPGQLGLIEEIDFFGDPDVLGRGLNDAGQVSFGLLFDDGTSALFVATLPEPARSTALVAGAVLLALCRARREGRLGRRGR